MNNQIGFTTASRDARSTFFATDVAKSLPCPIFHVNGDDPEAVVRAIDLAMRYRQKFGYDAVVDIQCYRRLGHNEADEPSFSHPLMYNMIKNHPSVKTIYGKRVAEAGVFSEADQKEFENTYTSVLKAEMEKARSGQKPNIDDAFERGEWQEYGHKHTFQPVATGVSKDRLHTSPTSSPRSPRTSTCTRSSSVSSQTGDRDGKTARPSTGRSPKASRSGACSWRRIPFASAERIRVAEPSASVTPSGGT